MTDQISKIAFIFVLYKTPQAEVERLTEEIKTLLIKNYKLYFIDNTKNNRGYAEGVNIGLKKALSDNCDIFFIANPDISFVNFQNNNFLQGLKEFDILGFAMKQQGRIYYGGEIDKWRMSGGLIFKKPKKRFQPVDFVSGSLMIIKKKVIEKIGLMDESYFLYYEEVDYCYRAKKDGFRIGIDSFLTYDHFEASKENPTKDYYLFKNRLKFLLRYGSFKQKFREVIRIPKTIVEEISKRPFYLNFFSLNFSSLINKILHFFLFITLIRYFQPEDYAIYTLAWTHIGLLMPILDFGTTSYGLVHLNHQNSKQASNLFSFRLALAFLTFIFTIFLAILFKYEKSVFYPIFLLSFVIFSNSLSGSFLIFSSVVKKSYLASLVSMVFQIILVAFLILGLLLTKKLMVVFWLIFIFYNFYSLINLFLIKKQVREIKFIFNSQSWRKIANQSFVFLLINLLAGAYSKLDVLLLNFLKGKTAVGIYSAGYRFLDALMFIVVAYNVSSMPIFSENIRLNEKKRFFQKIKKDLILVLIIGFLIAFTFFFFSPILLPIFFKDDYLLAISPLRIIIFSLPLILATSVALNSLYALKKANLVIYLFAFQLLFNGLANLFFIPIYSYIASAWISLIGEILNVLLSFAILGSVLKRTDFKRTIPYENFS